MEFLEHTFAQATRDEWERRLATLDVCFGAVNTLPEALEDPQALARGMVLRDDHQRPHIASPIRFHDEPSRPDLVSPALGQHQHLIKESNR
jgi:crotonobetainyl-CoA:carnitine CoA-transferase CaiB-like acyl-CoA transferase